MSFNIIRNRQHSKASEKYVDVCFNYSNTKLSTSIPIEYRRTGTEIKDSEVNDYLNLIYNEINPEGWSSWKNEQTKFWLAKPKAGVTKAFFDVLSSNFDWCCVTCSFPSNPNWARRIQDIKEFGYTLATHTSRACPKCQKNTTQLIMVPLKRGGITGYETWSPALRNRIITVLNEFDAFEAKKVKKEGLLPDHKFPEIRWDQNTKRSSLENLTNAEIVSDFQLLNNQRNQQKREVCRNCFQSDNRGVAYGIPFFYKGSSRWDSSIAKTGKDAETGCKGCAWYDLEKWRTELIVNLNLK
jgi:hypothetical protein